MPLPWTSLTEPLNAASAEPGLLHTNATTAPTRLSNSAPPLYLSSNDPSSVLHSSGSTGNEPQGLAAAANAAAAAAPVNAPSAGAALSAATAADTQSPDVALSTAANAAAAAIAPPTAIAATADALAKLQATALGALRPGQQPPPSLRQQQVSLPPPVHTPARPHLQHHSTSSTPPQAPHAPPKAISASPSPSSLASSQTWPSPCSASASAFAPGAAQSAAPALDPRFRVPPEVADTWRALWDLGPSDPLPERLPCDFYFNLYSHMQAGKYADLLVPYLRHFPAEK